MNKNIRIIGGLILVLSVLLSACSAVSTPTSGSNALPQTGATATAEASATGSDPLATSSPTQPGAAAVTAPSGSASSEVTYVLNPSKSQASYDVQEQLARFNFPTQAVGKTNNVTGQIALNPDGSIDQANSKFTVDLVSLATDSNMRDNYVRRNILQTDQWPQAVFVPTQITGLPTSLPQSGTVSFKVTGNLSIRNVSKPVTWDVTATINGGEVTGAATTNMTFEDFGIPQPQVPVVLSVVDKITLNLNFDMVKK